MLIVWKMVPWHLIEKNVGWMHMRGVLYVHWAYVKRTETLILRVWTLFKHP